MALSKVRIDEDGNMINVETGQVLGNVRHGGVNFNSSHAPIKTLQQAGGALPQIPDQDDEQEEEQNEDNKEVKEDKVIPKIPQKEQKSDEKLKIDKGLSSFKKQKSKYQISPDTFFIIRFGLYQNEEDGRIIPIRQDAVDDIRNAERHWVKFRMWSYREQLRWKQESTQYHTASRSQVINQDKLNQKKIRRLMLDWSFGEYDDRLKLLHCDGILSDQSYSLFYNMYPSIASTIVDLMNLVLESNQ